MIALRIQLLTERYIATAYNDRTRAEWPPHPARLFSALVATHHSRPEPPEDERAALEWLEAQGPPQIAAALEHGRRDVMTHFVPVNDTSVHSMPDRDLDKLEQAEAAVARLASELAAASSEAGRRKANKALEKARKKADKALKTLVKKSQKIASPGSRGGTEESALQLLPEQRVRQSRTFPSVTPADDVVWMAWPEAEGPESHHRALDRLVRDVARLGHSSSFVAISIHEETDAEPTLVPDDTGSTLLRVPGPGQLNALESEYARHRGVSPRVLPALHQAYRRPEVVEEEVPVSALGEDWLVLERIDGPRLPSRRTADVSRAIRGALMHFAEDPPPAVISGHTPDGAQHQGDHLACVPLPFMGSQHADGSILGVALILPRDASDEARREVARALARWEDAERSPDEAVPRLELRMGRQGVMGVRRVDGTPPLYTLQPWTWCGPARRWATATPIALGRNPGELRQRDPQKAAEAAEAAQDIIARAAGHVGLPTPEVRVVPAPPLIGGWRAHRFPRYPRSRRRLQRVLTHAVLEFPTPVRGPVILGAGRFRGLGLCRPLREED